MKISCIKNAISVFFFLVFSNSLAQERHQQSSGYCAADQLHSKLYNEDKTYQQRFNNINTDWQKWAIEYKQQAQNNSNNRSSSESQPAYTNETLPIVFHMMIGGTTSPNPNTSATDANLTKPQIQAALSVLNKLFAGQASGSKPAGLNTQIQFCLAEVDSKGAAITSYTCTNPLTGPLDNNNPAAIAVLSGAVQATGKFPTNKYINVYVVDDIIGNVAGFAYMPAAHGTSFDGIYIEAQYLLPPSVPNDLSYNMTVMTHEMGHYLGLFHTFGICTSLTQACSCNNNNCLFDGDMVCDTPPDFSQASGACTTPTNTCHTDVAAIGDNLNLTTDANDLIDNYMDYGNWNCENKFTAGQIKRMRFMIDKSVGPRNSLLNSTACNLGCANTSCTISINSPVATTNGITLPNTLILNGATVSWNFSGNLCGSYNARNWTAINLSNNAIMQSATTASFNVTFTSTGNYRILLKASVAGSTPLCYQTDTLDIKVLPPANCPANLDMSGGWLTNWQRIQYEGGWARVYENTSQFVFPTTTLTLISPTVANSTVQTYPFSMVSSLSADPNFSSLSLPTGITKIMRVGKVISSTNTLPPGDAAYVTYTFSPTQANSKLRVYFLGMKENDAYPQYPAGFAANVAGGTSFGYICSYDFNSITQPMVAHRGITHTGASGRGIYKNDMIADYAVQSFSTVTIGQRQFNKMAEWEYKDLDFSEFVCASPTITITFFARSDNAANLGFHHSYAYFAAKCLPANYQDLDLSLDNKDIPCLPNVGQSCSTMQLPKPYSMSPFETDYVYDDIFSLSVEESFTGTVFSPSGSYSLSWSFAPDGVFPVLSLCKTPDANPYKYFKISYRNLCQTVVDTLTIFQGYVHDLDECAPNPISGGHHINPPVGNSSYSPDQYVQHCGSAVLQLTKPCWVPATSTVQPEYKWLHNGADMNINAPSITVNDPYDNCSWYRRYAKYNDPYCGVPVWIESDAFFVTSLKKNEFGYSKQIIGPDVCGNSLATIKINDMYEYNDIEVCDSEMQQQLATAPVTNTISFSFYKSPNCTPSNSLTATSGPGVLTYTYQNSLSYNKRISPSFTFNNNGIYNSSGTAYIVVNSNYFGCISSFTMQVNINIKPSAVGGTIAVNGNNCASATYSFTGNNSNATGYAWEYSYSNSFATVVSIPSSNAPSVNIPASAFTTYPVYIRRKAMGTLDCPNTAYSNTVTVTSSGPTLSVTPSTTICAGNTGNIVINGTQPGISYSVAPGTGTVVLVIDGQYAVHVSPTVTTVYTVTATNTVTGCSSTATAAIVVVQTPTVNISASSNPVCAGSTVTLTASGAGYYSWVGVPGGLYTNTVVVTPADTVNYRVNGANEPFIINGVPNSPRCRTTAIIQINVIPGPALSVSPSATICALSQATLNASGASSYTWTNGTGSVTINPWIITPNTTTTYTVTGAGSNGCKKTATTSITLLQPDGKPVELTSKTGTAVCRGDEFKLNASGSGASSYTWASSPSTPLTPTVTSGALTGTLNTTTTFTATGTANNGCKSQATITIMVLPLPTIVITATPAAVCVNNTTTLSASGAQSYVWTSTPTTAITQNSTGSSKITNALSTASTFTVKGTATNGCSAQAVKTISINTSCPPVENCSMVSCTNGYITFFRYKAPLAVTTTSVNVQNISMYMHGQPILPIGVFSPPCPPAYPTHTISYVWTLVKTAGVGAPQTIATNVTTTHFSWTNLTPGLYDLTLSMIIKQTINGVVYSCTLNYTSDFGIGTGYYFSPLPKPLPGNETTLPHAVKNNWSVYPNPASNEVTINWSDLAGETVEEIKVYDINGKQTDAIVPEKEAQLYILPIQQYLPGTYLVKLKTNAGRYEQKVIVISK